MDESVKHELLLRLVPLSNRDLLSVIGVKKYVQSVTADDLRRQDLEDEIRVAEHLWAIRMDLA